MFTLFLLYLVRNDSNEDDQSIKKVQWDENAEALAIEYSNRTRYVQIDDSLSSPIPVTTGVPQRSILGPLLFILYINDICSVSNIVYPILYADDTTLISTLCVFDPIAGNNGDRSIAINRELGIITTWLEANKLSLNATKTKYMVFHSINFPEDSLLVLNLRLNNFPIEWVKQFDFLGLTVSDTLTWKDHVNKLANKIAISIGAMFRLKYQLDKTMSVHREYTAHVGGPDWPLVHHPHNYI